MLTFLLQSLSTLYDGTFYIFTALFILIFIQWVVRVILSRRYKTFDEPYETTTAVIIPVVDEPLDLFDSVLKRIKEQKPILITETGAEEQDDMSKAVWINSLYEMLQADPSMIGFIWFNEKKRANWRVDTSDSAVEAFHNGAVTYMQPKVPPTEAPRNETAE